MAAAWFFISMKCSGEVIGSSLSPYISILPNLSSPILKGFKLLSKSVDSFPKSWKKLAVILILESPLGFN